MTQRTKQLTWITFSACLGVIIGIAVAARFLAPSFPSQWFTLIAPPPPNAGVPSGNSVTVGEHVSISYSDATILESDIPAPHVVALSGKAKFVPCSPLSGERSPLGYIVTVAADPLDKSKLPEKYKKDKGIPTKGGPLVELPLEEATYEVYFVFRLLDRDGFELLTINSSKHDIESGKTTLIQAQTERMVMRETASLTDRITLHMVVQKCLSTRPE